MKKSLLISILISFAIISIIFVVLLVTYKQIAICVNNETTDNQAPIIVVDAGHGGEDGGAIANQLVEKNINLDISKKLSDCLVINGYKVEMTRQDDDSIEISGSTLKERKTSDMKERLKIYNKDDNRIVVSIHQNKFSSSDYFGTQVFYSKNNNNSFTLGESIKNSVKTLIQPDNNRECKPADKNIYLLYNSNNPSVIVECGFLSCYEEAKKLVDEKYQNNLVSAIFNGITDYIYSEK